MKKVTANSCFSYHWKVSVAFIINEMKNTDYTTTLEQSSLLFWCSISEKNHISVTVIRRK